MHCNGICVLTPAQAFEYEHHGTIPPCQNHRHLSRRKAEELIAEHIIFRNDGGDFVRYVEVRWVGRGKKFLTFIRSREWARRDSAGTVTMQLVPAGGAW